MIERSQGDSQGSSEVRRSTDGCQKRPQLQNRSPHDKRWVALLKLEPNGKLKPHQLVGVGDTEPELTEGTGIGLDLLKVTMGKPVVSKR